MVRNYNIFFHIEFVRVHYLMNITFSVHIRYLVGKTNMTQTYTTYNNIIFIVHLDAASIVYDIIISKQ